MVYLAAHKQSHQRVWAPLTTPMPMHLGIKHGPFGQHIGRIKMLPRVEDARAAILQADFHLPRQYKDPLGMRADMKGTAKSHRAFAQLIAATGHEARQSRLRRALVQGQDLLAKTRTPIGVGEQNGLCESAHGVDHKGWAERHLQSDLLSQPLD